ncbi:hypothetical protein [Vulcanisaeta sp. JCM 14467]
MERDAIQLISEANRIAFRVARIEYRKAIGLAYIYWSTMTFIYTILYVAIYEFGVTALMNNIGYVIIPAVVDISYGLIFVLTIVKRFKRAFIIANPNYPKTSRWKYLLKTYIGLILVIIFVGAYTVLSFMPVSATYTLASMVLNTSFAFVVVFFLMYRPMVGLGVKVRYYDYLAWVTYIVSVLLGPLYYVAYYVYPVFWIFAGTMSLLEVIEGGRD